MEKVLNMTFASSITELRSLNSSFDSGILRIAYPGLNHNRSDISKDVFEKCLPTMFGCPVVCRYDRDSDTLGGHDVEVVRDADGSMRLVNTTVPVGFVPQGANTWWEPVTEDDGTEHEYLCCEVLLWKRQEAYRKIKRDGVTAQSMEITVKDGEVIDDIFHIYDFEFTAFTLIGVTPCFESASLSLYSTQDFKACLMEMLRDAKETFSMVVPSAEDNDTQTTEKQTEGGERVLQEKIELAAQYGIQIETLDYSLDDYTVEELKEKFEAMKQEQNDEAGTEPEANAETGTYALTGNILEELCRALEAVTITREWGECARYWYVDCDFDAGEVYCWDVSDWLLYGFAYSMNGDSVMIDFDSKKRMKYVIEEFEGEQASPVAALFAAMEQRVTDASQWEQKYADASGRIESLESELTELRAFREQAENDAAEEAREQIFARFADLDGIEAFERLREDCAAMSVEDIEEKCYAIRGRNSGMKFALEDKTPKLIVTKTAQAAEPYGGLFAEYGISITE